LAEPYRCGLAEPYRCGLAGLISQADQSALKGASISLAPYQCPSALLPIGAPYQLCPSCLFPPYLL
jgi:hypothetical protein